MSIRSVAREIAYNIGKVAYRTETTRSIFKYGAKLCRQVGPLILSDYQTGDVIVRLEMARHSTIPPQLPVHRYEAPDLDLPPVVINLADGRVEASEVPAKQRRSSAEKLSLEELLGRLMLIQQAQDELKNAPLEDLGARLKKWNSILAPVVPKIGRINDAIDRIKTIISAGFKGEPFDQAGLEEALQEWRQLSTSDSGLLETVAIMSTAYLLYRAEPERLTLELDNSVRLAKNRELALQMKKIFESDPENINRELEVLFKNWQSTAKLPTPETLKMEVVLEGIKQDQRRYPALAQPERVEDEADRPFKDYLKKKPK